MVHPAYFAIPLISMGIAAIYYLIRPVVQGNSNADQPRTTNPGASTLARKGAVRRRRPMEYNHECTICFDAECNVEIYPCRHRDICEKCIHVIITKLDRLCPLCRQYITGYRNF